VVNYLVTAHWMLFQIFVTSMVSHVTVCADGLRRPKSGIGRYIPASYGNFEYLTESLWTKHPYILPRRLFGCLALQDKTFKQYAFCRSPLRTTIGHPLVSQPTGLPSILGKNMQDWRWVKWLYDTSFFEYFCFPPSLLFQKHNLFIFYSSITDATRS
jgi:hypothetical protein